MEETITLNNGTTVLLRPVRPDDAADLVVIQQQVIEEGISNVGDDLDSVEDRQKELEKFPATNLWVVAEHQGQVVGSLELHRPGAPFLAHHAQLGIELHRDWRGLRLGSAMMSYAITWGKANGLEMIRLGVLDTNPNAKRLYERLGFRTIGHFPDFVKKRDGSYSGDTMMILDLTDAP